MSVGTQLADAGRSAEGIALLREALDEPTEVYPLYRNLTLLKIAREVGKSNSKGATGFIDQAIEIVRRSPLIPETELIKALGEKAVALWLADDLAAAYAPLQEGAERLLAINPRDDEGKALFMIFGHVSGFLSHLARTGEYIQHTPDDSDYAPPERGMLLKFHPKMSSIYREELVRYLPAQMAIFAKGIGKEADAAKWSLLAVDAARASGDQTALSQVAHLALESLVIENKVPEAFDVALHLGISIAALKIDQAAGRNPMRRDFDVLNILGAKTNEGWLEAEDYAAVAGLLPFFFRLALFKLNGDEGLHASVEILTTVCRQIAATASNPKLWIDAAELLQGFFSGDLSGADLMEKAKSFSDPHTTSLQALSFLSAGFESSSEQAVHNQLETLPFLVDFFRGLELIYEKILTPFYKTFWFKMLCENRFSFRTPNMVEQRLEEISESTEWIVVPKILMLVSSSLGVAPSQKVSSWLEKNV